MVRKAAARQMQGSSPMLDASKYLVIAAFSIAVYAAMAQFSAYPAISGSAFQLAYFAFPFLVVAIFFAVYAYSWAMIEETWQKKSWKCLSWAAGVGYALFYIFVTNTVSVPDVAVPKGLASGYVVAFEVYGPMAVWPDVEFYSPTVNLTGYFSVGNVLLFASLGFLTAFAVSLLMRNVSVRRSKGRGGAASMAGAFLTALSTNACCCCTPVLLPVLALVFGGTLSGAIAYSLLNPESPVSNLLTLATLGSLTASVILSTRSCRRTEKTRTKATAEITTPPSVSSPGRGSEAS